jgi:hypothetical protein
MIEGININMNQEHDDSIDGVPSLSEEEAKQLFEELELNEKFVQFENVKRKDFDTLNAILSEYLDSFIVMGYSTEGDEVICHKLKNSRDIRSLASLLDEMHVSNFIDIISSDYDDE